MSTFETLSLEINGLQAISHVRPGSGTPLVLVHGIGPGTDGFANFGPILDRLAPGHPLFVLDLIGFGASWNNAVPARFDADLWTRQIEAVLDRIGQPAILLGNSVGGALSMRVACRARALHGVVALGAPLAGDAPTAELAAFWRAPADKAAMTAGMAPMAATVSTPDPAIVAQRWAAFDRPGYPAWFAETLADPSHALRSVRLSPADAASLSHPAHILHGREDRACPATPVARLAVDHMPNATLCVFAGCGHHVIMTHANETLMAVDRLLKGISA
jgi:pimeloyl-ACP methyl ester carboxylesterase